MHALDVIYHDRNNQILPLKLIVPSARYGILPVTFLHSCAVHLAGAAPAVTFRQTRDFSLNYRFYSAYKYMLIDDHGTCRMLTSNAEQTDWFFDIDLTRRLSSSQLQAA
ncbi:MAG: hypothetical protein EON60_11665 [Alphaproteobacteria bacterium]|nr:MAG: hypothetical protein EON60_11665 [Alphaproteobacteria bacterium]